MQTIIDIEPEYLVVFTGYDKRFCEKDNLKQFEEMVLEDINMDYEDEEHVKIIGLQSYVFSDSMKEGLKIKVRSMSNISEILRFYRGYLAPDRTTFINWYCTCFDFYDMKYDTATKTLFVFFDAESG